MPRVNVTIKNAFQYNGQLVSPGDVVEMDENRAVNHMRVGDIERDEALIAAIKERRVNAAEAAKADAQADW